MGLRNQHKICETIFKDCFNAQYYSKFLQEMLPILLEDVLQELWRNMRLFTLPWIDLQFYQIFIDVPSLKEVNSVSELFFSHYLYYYPLKTGHRYIIAFYSKLHNYLIITS